jgi:hypothetical protein
VRIVDPLDTSSTGMTKLLGFIGSSIGGAIGWAAGAGVGTMTAFMLCVVGTAAGLYGGRRAARALEA